MENDKPYDPYAKDTQIKNDYLKENHVLKNERSMRGDSLDGSQGARLRMDAAESCANQSSAPLETLEQERNRLSRKLIQTLSENETRIRVLKDMLESLERWQKNGYYLRDSINNSSQIQMDQIHQMREYLK
jgi:hypothetical protein